MEDKKLAIDGGVPVRKNTLAFNKPFLGQEEIEAAKAVIESGEIGGNGSECKILEESLKRYTKAKYVIATNSCTAAFQMSLIVARLEPGDEVIIPSFSFVSIANALVLMGIKPVFVDIEDTYYNLDYKLIEKAITNHTKAIVVIHYAGIAASMDEILDIAKRHHLLVIEDAAHALGSFYKGQNLGTIGDMGCYSFHVTKNLTCGEGGAFVTNNDEYYKLAEYALEKGTDRSDFLKGEKKKYVWVSKGGSYVLSDVLAAVASTQLKKADFIIKRRREIAVYLTEKLAKYEPLISLPKIPSYAEINWHIYAIKVSRDKRDWVIQALKAEGINTTSHFEPLHLSPFALKNWSYHTGDLPITEEICGSLIRLPIYPKLTQQDLDDIVAAFDKIIPYLDK